jgi:pimeloyl-ACP methyl ester carboxylesterase
MAAEIPAPLSIARQGHLFAGGSYTAGDGGQVMSGQLYAEFQIPSALAHGDPIVMVHGGGQSGTNFTGTPDGREGWAQFFLRRGYAVYVVDQVGRGRAPYAPIRYGALAFPDCARSQQRFVGMERYKLWPQAERHTQWPGGAAPGDTVFDQFYAAQLPGIADFTLQQSLNRDALLALLAKIGPATLLTHSQAGTFGWAVADARPDLVTAILAIEPNGPPFYECEMVGAPAYLRDGAKIRPFGPTAVPLTYLPPVHAAEELAIRREERADGPGLARCWVQAEPARQLPNLQKMPILILTAEASYHAPYDHCTVKFLEQAGVHPSWIQLAALGITGNGHMMMLEKNNQEIAAVLADWLEQQKGAR